MSNDIPVVLDLVKIGEEQPVDRDYSLGNFKGTTLIRLSPNLNNNTYPSEVHEKTEFIIAIDGEFSIVTNKKEFIVGRGQGIKIPPDVRHRWGSQSSATVLVMFSLD